MKIKFIILYVNLPFMSLWCDAQNNKNIKEHYKLYYSQMQKQGEKGKGEKTSKELIELARQQEEIKKQLLEIRNDIGKNGEKGEIDNAIKNMEDNERDIINDEITQETIDRQQKILTRLLDAEDSKREQDQEENRSSNEWYLDITR